MDKLPTARAHATRKSPISLSNWIVRLVLGVAILAALRLLYLVVIFVALGQIRFNQAYMVPFAQVELHSSNSFVRQGAAEALGTIGPKAATSLPDLLESIRKDSPDAAAAAAWAVGNIVGLDGHSGKSLDPEVLATLIDALDHSDGEVRRYAAYAIGLIGPPACAATPELTRLLDDQHTASTAVRALGEMGPAAQGSVQPMTALLSSQVWGVRLETLLALSRFDTLPKETISAVRERLNDNDKRVRDAAERALTYFDSNR